MSRYLVSITCTWSEEVKADNIEEAIQKMRQKYKYGKGRFPREYVDVYSYEDDPWCEIE